MKNRTFAFVSTATFACFLLQASAFAIRPFCVVFSIMVHIVFNHPPVFAICHAFDNNEHCKRKYATDKLVAPELLPIS
jgi:hypothetical protein